VRVLITGGTGFVGAHTAADLSRAGHDIRLLVRDPARIEAALGPLGLAQVDYTVADVTDRQAVTKAMAGCEALVHAAALVTFDRRHAEEVTRVNVEAARSVVQSAVDLQLDPIVLVSSVSALHPPQAPVLTRDSPVGSGGDLYTSSKAAAEVVARQFQSEGAPVVITYPGGVWGPHDPNLGENTRAMAFMARMPVIPQTSGGYLIIDVRDLAAVHTAVLEPGRGPRRFTVGGNFLDGRQLRKVFADVTGRRAYVAPAPDWIYRGMGRIGDVVNERLTSRLPFTAEGMDTLVRSVPTDDTPTCSELGVTYRDPGVTIGDTLVWLHQRGQISKAQLGRLAVKP
jgi:nucleoside-diphosphate-sugar epimerase